MNLILLALGGSIGAISRYLLGLAIMKRFPSPPFPIAMLIVNLLGAGGLGGFFGIYYKSIPLAAYEDPLYLTIGIGFFGAFTTFSTFSVEAVQLYNKKKWAKLGTYVFVSIVGSIICFLIGFKLGKLIV
ncbi:fluoride efflux transporter CrcB [Halalkalibacter krulwichiae]|uniref:Fluoride-specific ion channel FluC n=1 Tax=Halalkalibacter krulwichiae TaxID=199441 RepID=A0A1X9M770_9BACI|nr:fluoride efflux transporter CrcB [Halalkalibacter krulwichiae]ARK29268.1 Putative fluoride ion transporter CrcB [Halalkalibacter krulwichiae]